MVPPLSSSASEAFVIRFITTCRICALLARIGGTVAGTSICSAAFLEIEIVINCSISRTSPARSTSSSAALFLARVDHQLPHDLGCAHSRQPNVLEYLL